MRAVVQRVTRASVLIDGREHAAVGPGLVVLAGVAKGDEESDVNYLADKLANLRILADDAGRMNLSVLDTAGEVLLVSQFTLIADTRKGRRPSFIAAEAPERAAKLIDDLGTALAARGVPVRAGQFQAHMEVDLVNDGPVTIVIDSNDRRIPRRQAQAR